MRKGRPDLMTRRSRSRYAMPASRGGAGTATKNARQRTDDAGRPAEAMRCPSRDRRGDKDGNVTAGASLAADSS